MPPELTVLTALREIVAVAGLMLIIRGLMWSLGPKARNNFIYGIFTVGSIPFINFARAITPRKVPDRYMPTVAFLLVFALWLALALGVQALCTRPGVQCA